MAEAIPFGIVIEILKKLGSFISNETSLVSDVRGEACKLHSTLSAIHARLLDADEKKERSHLIQDWIGKLNDVVYEADDVLDLIAGKALSCHYSRFDDKVSEFFSSDNSLVFYYKMGHKIKEIRKRLDEVAKDMSQFNFTERIWNRETIKVRCRDETHSFVLESKTFGRVQNKYDIIDLLMPVNCQKDVSVVAIVGMGGLGKTTLAQLVYNDKKVKNHFDQRMWVCVSNDFSVKLLVRKIIEAATKRDPGDLELNLLQECLRKRLNEKKYLLVLDDIWNENHHEWESLLDLLVGGAKGSKILTTTRSTKVASIMGVMSPYILRGLSEDNCWNLFEKLAFGEERDRVHPNLITIGKKIIKKCKGVPLAVKTLGSMLRCTSDEIEWLSILNSQLWELPQHDNDILPALKLSYDHLPIYLKQCFAYCCLFPKDHEIDKDMLVKLWMAQGYLQSSNENQTLEAIGDRYCKELLSRSLLEKVEMDSTIIKLHDLVHDLARSVICRRVYHVYYSGGRIKQDIIIDSKRIKTLIVPSQLTNISSLSKLRSIHTLHIHAIEKVPSFIDSFKHLRYLNFSNSAMRRLPSSVCTLYHLMTLDLSNCMALTELPKKIRKLVSLRHLMTDGCKHLTSMPSGLGKLTSLRTLDVFRLGYCKLNELDNLIHLSGKLCIKNLGNARRYASKLDPTILEGKKYLHSLELDWDVFPNDEEDSKCDEMLMKWLQPPPNLNLLTVKYFAGGRLPIRMINDYSSSSLPNLVEIVIYGAYRCHHLPAFDQLPCLKFLHLEYLGSLEYVHDNNGMSLSLLPMNDTSNREIKEKIKTFFPSLKILNLLELPRLKGWWNEVKAEGTSFTEDQSQQLIKPAFPCLVELNISRCPKLSSLPLHPSLERLSLCKVNGKISGRSILHNYGVQFQGLKNLYSLTFDSIPDLEYLPDALQHVTTLQYLEIQNCLGFKALPEWIGNFESIKSIEIRGCPALRSIPEGMNWLEDIDGFKLTNICQNYGEDWTESITLGSL